MDIGMQKLLVEAQMALLKTPCMSAANISAGLAKSSTLSLGQRVVWAAKAALLSAAVASDPLFYEVLRERGSKVTMGQADEALLGVLLSHEEEGADFPAAECVDAIRGLYGLPPTRG